MSGGPGPGQREAEGHPLQVVDVGEVIAVARRALLLAAGRRRERRVGRVARQAESADRLIVLLMTKCEKKIKLNI